MAYTEGTLGALLQGVSQQPERLRSEGQVTEQLNYDSDVRTGLTSRPGTNLVATLKDATTDVTIQRVDFKGTTLLIGHKLGAMFVWGLDGTKYTLTYGHTALYPTKTMVFHVDAEAGHIKCLSPSITVQMSGVVSGYPLEVATATCLGALFDRTYSITLTASNGDSFTVEYTTPDGTNTGDGTKTSAENVMTELETAWNAATLPAGFTATTLVRHKGVLMWSDPGELKITASDGDSGDTIRFADRAVKDVTHLPSTTAHGHTVLVKGGRSVDDDYYLQFHSDVTSTIGDGFGSEGVWRETADPTIDSSFDNQTMPHMLEIDVVAKTAVFSEIDWKPRQVGDAASNKEPPFVGNTINDMVIFEGRLLVLTGGAVYTTRTDHTDDFWKKSATVDADSDPLDFRSTAVDGVSLKWIIPFDRDLLLVADPGDAQFVIRGGGLTPSNASMVLTTQYFVDAGVRPVSTGRTIILPYRDGNYTGINEFFTQNDTSANAADPLTAVQSRYISAPLRSLAVAANFSRISMTSVGQKGRMWVYRYLWDGVDRLQSAWFQLSLDGRIETHFYNSSTMYVVMWPDDALDAVLVSMDMNRVEDNVLGFHAVLDKKIMRTSDLESAIVVPYGGGVVVQHAGCQSPGQLAKIVSYVQQSTDSWRVVLDTAQCPAGASVLVGQEVTRRLVPTMPQPRNFQGEVVSNATLNIRHFLLHMSNSPDVSATRSSSVRTDDQVHYPRTLPESLGLLGPALTGSRDYVLKVPWREAYNRSTLTITCDDIRPDTIHEIEWAGDLRGVRRRV